MTKQLNNNNVWCSSWFLHYTIQSNKQAVWKLCSKLHAQRWERHDLMTKQQQQHDQREQTSPALLCPSLNAWQEKGAISWVFSTRLEALKSHMEMSLGVCFFWFVSLHMTAAVFSMNQQKRTFLDTPFFLFLWKNSERLKMGIMTSIYSFHWPYTEAHRGFRAG